MNVLVVRRVDFDNMENKIGDAESSKEVRAFGDDVEKTAHLKASEFISGLDVKMYLGWNREVYPKFIVSNRHVS